MDRFRILSNPASRLILARNFSAGKDGKGNNDPTGKNIELPPEPTTCCMSGCQNCVWIQYANELTKLLDDGGEQAREIVLQKITDPSLKMFLRMELQNLHSVKKEPPSE
ncbi:AAEL013871-PC [Aedes aegypti]|uniref:Oxidoreductase-like domain-containing protein n=2 Tax=Aedes aegypti TaxID=7159 RepID=A0A8W7IA61_AEDAE|nr:oxidoreductase-like domain-containing protein 1 [Aedes aegypti]XP_001657185.1 oxidoreductase-like domain-containing protein 1 [Aedes aegypti]EAT33859.1 AAEL013871-PA [Aedes aegypti]EAT33860.1 AAEL013871-PB [Aedes aegypti]EJY58060.1 AAEL013871-PC [Aedes aegypti]